MDATVTNVGAVPVYLRAGDGFNSALEQQILYAAAGSHAQLQRRSDGAWVNATAGVLVEGVRMVMLRPGRSYALSGPVDHVTPGATYRIRVEYSDRAEDDDRPGQHVDFSEEFRIP